VLVTGIQPDQVLGLKEIFPAPQTRRCSHLCDKHRDDGSGEIAVLRDVSWAVPMRLGSAAGFPYLLISDNLRCLISAADSTIR
jgi:hypothetical protein